MKVALFVLLPLAFIVINLIFMEVDRKNKISIEEAKVRAALELREASEDLRRQQHERQLAELRAIGDAKAPKAKLLADPNHVPVRGKRADAEPAVSPESFESTPYIKVASQPMMSVSREHLADMGVFVEDEREQTF